MKRIICFCLLLVLILCACGKTEDGNAEEAATKMIDFSDYTIEEVIAWANENNVIQKFSFVYSADTDKPSNCVIAQSAESGSKITDGIVITVSSKPMLTADSDKVVIPNVIGKNFYDAKEELTALGLQVDAKYESSSKEKDTVLLSDPLPCNSVNKNGKVILTLSAGENKSQVLITLTIASESSNENQIKVYVDGELDRSKTVLLDPSVTSITFTFTGKGKKVVKFKINDKVTAVYDVDFSTKEAIKIG